MKTDLKKTASLFLDIITANAGIESIDRISSTSKPITEGKIAGFNFAFAATPRITGKKIIFITPEQKQDLGEINIEGWTADRLTRVWLLMQIDSSDKSRYLELIEQLFKAAEMNELVALYSALPFLHYQEEWRLRCAEGIRSNIGTVLESIMYNNPYPSEYLPDAAWNQLVLKAIFTGKDISRIIGIDKRANSDLARILSDYAHERWSAQRTVDPQLWRCVGRFINAGLFDDIKKLVASGNDLEKEAAMLACADSDFPAAKDMLDKEAFYKKEIASGALSWDILARKSLHAVG